MPRRPHMVAMSMQELKDLEMCVSTRISEFESVDAREETARYKALALRLERVRRDIQKSSTARTLNNVHQ
jgi:hypothetical protein